MEGAAFARLAVDLELSTHQPDQLGADRQSQASAAVFTRMRAVRLPERLKNELLLFSRHAQTRVDYSEAHQDLRTATVFRGHLQPNRTPVAELDRVTHQVQQHLPQAIRIA